MAADAELIPSVSNGCELSGVRLRQLACSASDSEMLNISLGPASMFPPLADETLSVEGVWLKMDAWRKVGLSGWGLHAPSTMGD